MELLLLRFGAAFLLPRLRDLRFADFLLGAAFLREARRLFGAMVKYKDAFLRGSHIMPYQTSALYHYHHKHQLEQAQNFHTPISVNHSHGGNLVSHAGVSTIKRSPNLTHHCKSTDTNLRTTPLWKTVIPLPVVQIRRFQV